MPKPKHGRGDLSRRSSGLRTTNPSDLPPAEVVVAPPVRIGGHVEAQASHFVDGPGPTEVQTEVQRGTEKVVVPTVGIVGLVKKSAKFTLRGILHFELKPEVLGRAQVRAPPTVLVGLARFDQGDARLVRDGTSDRPLQIEISPSHRVPTEVV